MSGSKAHMLNFSLICLVILNFDSFNYLSTLSLEAGICVLFFCWNMLRKKGKKGKNCAVVVVLVNFFLEILHRYFFFVMICKIDLNINLVKMALIIFISDEAIFCFWRTVIMTREFTLLSKIWNLAFCDFHVSYFFFFRKT